MSLEPSSSQPASAHPDRASPAAFPRLQIGWWLAVVSLVAAVWLAYANSRHGAFHFDDFGSIVENPTLRSLRTALRPPAAGLPVTGRPLVNLTLALNYRWGGTDPEGYHLGNILLHSLATLLVFGLVRRTLQRPPLAARFSGAALPLAWAVALLWAVHPLNTAAVTYVSQRAEIMVALCYLGALYAFVRALEGGRGGLWLAAAAAACWAGMASKEVMVSAPLILLLYDRMFGAGGLLSALRRRPWFYVAVAASWGLLGWLMLHSGGRGGTAGFGMKLSPWLYACSQAQALVHYLALAIWPTPLIFDYGGTRLVPGLAAVWPQAVAIVGLFAGTVWLYLRGSVAGLVGLACFAILAPTSSFVPVADTVFEHRMYLPLAFLIALLVCGSHLALARRSWMGMLAVLALGTMTVLRNAAYRTELSLWLDTAVKRPDNVRAHYTLGTAYSAEGRIEAAIAQYQQALALDPKSAPAHNNLGNALVLLGRIEEALHEYEEALRLAPSAEAHNNVANLLMKLGRRGPAREHYVAALVMRPNLADAHNNLGNLMAESGALPEAANHYEAALRLRPDLADAHANLANVLAQMGKPADALAHYEAALRLSPDFADAHFNYATTLAGLRRWQDAVAQFEITLRLRPDYPGARTALERAKMAADIFGK